jgi:hypothetical protein
MGNRVRRRGTFTLLHVGSNEWQIFSHLRLYIQHVLAPTQAPEECRKKLSALRRQDPPEDWQIVVQPDVTWNIVEGMAGTGLWVVGTIDEAFDTGVDESTGAHGARFQGDKQVGIVEVPGAGSAGGLLEGQNFGVSGGIAASLPTVAGSPNDDPVANHDGPHRDLAQALGIERFSDRRAHMVLNTFIGEKIRYGHFGILTN